MQLTANRVSTPQHGHVERPPADHPVATGRYVGALHGVRAAVLKWN